MHIFTFTQFSASQASPLRQPEREKGLPHAWKVPVSEDAVARASPRISRRICIARVVACNITPDSGTNDPHLRTSYKCSLISVIIPGSLRFREQRVSKDERGRLHRGYLLVVVRKALLGDGGKPHRLRHRSLGRVDDRCLNQGCLHLNATRRSTGGESHIGDVIAAVIVPGENSRSVPPLPKASILPTNLEAGPHRGCRTPRGRGRSRTVRSGCRPIGAHRSKLHNKPLR